MTVAINPADKSLIVVIELLLWMQPETLGAMSSFPKAQSRLALAASNVCDTNQSFQRIVFVVPFDCID
jgi:hypothetical protein